MLTLAQTLARPEYDLHLLGLIANRWDVDLGTRQADKAAQLLAKTMLNPQSAAHEWGRLTDRERAALQMLLAAKGHKMSAAQFFRLFGEIRQMGEDKRQRETPHLNPQGVAEVLYYRGLLSLTYDQTATGRQLFVYVPSDLAAILPTHQTGYDLSAPLPAQERALAPLEEEEEDFPPTETQLVYKADTSLVDDLTTLLAFLQLYDVRPEKESLTEEAASAVSAYFLKGHNDPLRLGLMVGVARGLDLLAEDSNGYLKPQPANARRWLEKTRSQQVQALVEGWLKTPFFAELNYLPNLIVEAGSWRVDPTLARQTLQLFLGQVSPEAWFSVAAFILRIKREDPDFQRPAANYDSWYIRDVDSQQYLHGFEHWERIDGGVLYLALSESLVWLGLVDRGENEDGLMVRLNAYGRAFVRGSAYPQATETPSSLVFEGAERFRVARAFNRYERFQLARFTDWESAGDPYLYRLTAESLRRAERQGIKIEHIRTFLKRATQNNIPPETLTLLEQWEVLGNSTFNIGTLDVLFAPNEAALEALWEAPETRRFLGRRLGPLAVEVRAGQRPQLTEALSQKGLSLEED